MESSNLRLTEKQSMASRLRTLIESPEILVLPGVYDAITGRLATETGFKAVYMTGAGISNAQLGVPDIGLAGLAEMAGSASRIASAITVPLICDADTGYGDVHSVMRTVQMYAQAGAAGLHLEDQVSPKRCGHLSGKELIPGPEMVAKVKAARVAALDSDLFIVARTDSRAVEGLESSIRRAEAYVAAGADAIFPEALESVEEFESFAQADLGVPLIANMTEFGRTPLISAREFEQLGYSAVIFPMSALRIALAAIQELYVALYEEGTQAGLVDRMWTRQRLYELLNYTSYDRVSDQFMVESRG